MILKLSAITHLRCLVKERADVIPSPVGPAIVNVVCPSPPKPIPAYEGAFLTNIVVSTALANLDKLSIFFECMCAECLLPPSALQAKSIASSISLTLTIPVVGISSSS